MQFKKNSTLKQEGNMNQSFKKEKERNIRVNISIHPEVLKMIDNAANSLYMSRSSFLTEAVNNFKVRSKESI
jgi:hypothetical protein